VTVRKSILAGATAVVMLAPVAMADATNYAATLAMITGEQICGGPAVAADAKSPANMVMVDGFGTGGFKVDTTNPDAQAWFDHGVRLRWAFEHAESVRAFRKAQRLDPQCGMCAWGEAWAIGPNLNGGGRDAGSIATGLRAAREARRLARDAPRAHRQMIEALIQRYSGREQTRADRFARAMDRIVERNPDDVAVSNIAADAWILSVKGPWWDKNGKAADPGVTRAMSLLEHALSVQPDDPGAIHLYIHLTEWSDDPGRALAYGERLARIAPGASHLVHMPAHTFYRVGRYRDAMMSNVNAVALDKRYDRLASPPGGVKGMPLHGHNIHFGMGGALMAGGAEQGLELADSFMETYPDLAAGPAPGDDPALAYRQVMAVNAYAVYGRFASAARVAELPEPGRPMMRVGWRYARGEAAARRGDTAAVRAEALAIGALVAQDKFSGPVLGGWREVSPARQKDFARTLQKVLEGRAAMLDKDYAAARTAYAEAATIQAKHPEGGDPPSIWYPTRRSLAAALLASGDAAGAKAKIEELLKDWPSDPYSYFILSKAEAALGHDAAADQALRRSRVEWIGGAMSLNAA
jgi:tetratricopeptide (TPR) repeat protein